MVGCLFASGAHDSLKDMILQGFITKPIPVIFYRLVKLIPPSQRYEGMTTRA